MSAVFLVDREWLAKIYHLLRDVHNHDNLALFSPRDWNDKIKLNHFEMRAKELLKQFPDLDNQNKITR